jgi:hypothetical protein
VFWGAVVEDAARDFFISYTAVDEPWARWIAVTLEDAGYTTVLQAFDFRPGRDFIHMMQLATSDAARTIAVLSPAYFGSRFGEAEWRAAYVKDATGEQGLLVPVRVELCRPLGLLASRVYIDLVDVDEPTAQQRLLEGVDTAGARPTSAPFPGRAGDAASGSGCFPRLGPEVSNLSPRNVHFTGRGEDLERPHVDLLADSGAGVVLSKEETFPLVSSVRTSNGRRPCLAAVERWERSAAKSWAPARVRRHPDTFCLILATRLSRSAALLSIGTRRSVARRRYSSRRWHGALARCISRCRSSR